MSDFKPEKHNFILLKHENPWGLDFYELNNSAKLDGELNFLRMNVYLSKDGEFVTIWNGLFDVTFAEMKLEDLKKPKDINLTEQYRQDLFRGYITSSEEAHVILNALHFDMTSLPQILTSDENNNLICKPI